MCGIIGYCGPRKASEVLLSGLKRLEYRGYDSAGICVGHENRFKIVKKKGDFQNLRKAVPQAWEGYWGIGHTRWATHGTVNDKNAHPHADCKNNIAICHNGIIENSLILKERLLKEGHVFYSETDSEIVAHLVESFYKGDLEKAVRSSVSLLKGTYGILVMHRSHPDEIIGARNGSPMILGIGDKEMFIASDAHAVIAYTKQVVYLEDGEIVRLQPQIFTVTDIRSRVIDKSLESLSWELEEMERGIFPHYMLKEIHEQSDAILRAMRGRLDTEQASAVFGGLNMSDTELLRVKRVVLIAAGSSYYASCVAAYVFEAMARIPARTELASELRYRNPIVEEDTLYIASSQSGETLDTLMAIRELKRKGAKVIGICNVVGSSIARESDGGIYTHAGPEIAVASTKAFTSQLTVLYLFILKLARMRHLSWPEGHQFLAELQEIPGKIQAILAQSEKIEALADQFYRAKNFLFLGRGINYPVATEGALKLKEIAYIHAEGYSAAEIKHGPIALVNDSTPSLFLVPDDYLREKLLSSMQEIQARKGSVIALCFEDDNRVAALADAVISLPRAGAFFSPFLMLLPLQLFAYYSALKLGHNVDRPRHLAKSVTVE